LRCVRSHTLPASSHHRDLHTQEITTTLQSPWPGAGADLFLEEGPEALGGGVAESGTGASAALPQVQPDYLAAEFG
ncbi:hypothetical protein, partial [Streptomyces sp. NPDC057910]|uniref:hypothetical protein n=1 Tax=Streptomyces sp. NPDC057910 TaxID=3346278 RepID=UPI0036DFD86E